VIHLLPFDELRPIVAQTAAADVRREETITGRVRKLTHRMAAIRDDVRRRRANRRTSQGE
jgi:hypothetical protein